MKNSRSNESIRLLPLFDFQTREFKVVLGTVFTSDSGSERVRTPGLCYWAVFRLLTLYRFSFPSVSSSIRTSTLSIMSNTCRAMCTAWSHGAQIKRVSGGQSHSRVDLKLTHLNPGRWIQVRQLLVADGDGEQRISCKRAGEAVITSSIWDATETGTVIWPLAPLFLASWVLCSSIL